MIALVDCNSFFCSCERLFRPDLKNKPVVVLSNNDGCIISRTQEAKQLGLKMGGPYFEIKSFCTKYDVHVFSSNFSLYTNISDRVMSTLEKFSSLVEIYSVDEAFLDLSTCQNDLKVMGKKIKQTIDQEIGIPVGVGIAKTKALAKVANYLAKKSDEVVVLDNEEVVNDALKLVPIEDLWGVGRQNQIKMKALGIMTAYDFKNYDNEKHIQSVFTKTGLQLKKELEGISCFSLSKATPKKKSILSSRSFGQVVTSKEELKKSIAYHISLAAQSLRKQNSLCSQLYIFLRTSYYGKTEFHSKTTQINFSVPVDDTLFLIEQGMKAVDKIYQQNILYKKAGVGLEKIVDNDSYQLGLFDRPNNERKTLMNLMDQINNREGKFTLKSMACGVDNSLWKMKQDFKSPRYTTSWNDLYKLK